jgi:hypothetical protein
VTADLLYQEAEALAHPCLLLKDSGDPSTKAGVWRSNTHVERNGESYVQRLSLDCRYLPKTLGLKRGCVSLYLDEDEIEGFAIHEPDLQLEAIGSGQVLYLHQTRSLPPLEAIMRFGSSSVEVWLDKIGLSRNDEWTPDTAEARGYIARWTREYPMYQPEIHAVVGGWHFPWPDRDWGQRLEETLLFWTLADAEPWLEVWHAQSELQVIPRVT